jgi:hypothetical protein
VEVVRLSPDALFVHEIDHRLASIPRLPARITKTPAGAGVEGGA